MSLIRPGMGTENSIELLYTLIQMARPRTVLEIGAGDSTRLIAKALQKRNYHGNKIKNFRILHLGRAHSFT